MVVVAVVEEVVQVHQGVGAEGLPEGEDEFGVEVADLGGVEGVFVDVPGATGQVDGGRDHGLFHRESEVAVAIDSLLIADSLFEGLAEGDAGVFDGMVKVDVNVAIDLQVEVEQAVAGEESQHVIEEADASRDVVLAGPVEVEGQLDFGFGGVA